MSNAQAFESCRCGGSPVFIAEICQKCGLRSPLDAPDLCTIGQAAKALGTRVSVVREFVQKFGPAAQLGRQIRVRLADVRPWFDDREQERRLYDEVMTIPD